MSYKHLQNGSDIRGVALEGIQGENVNLTKEAVYDLARGFYAYLSRKYKKSNCKIAIGQDSRLSGDDLKASIIDGLLFDGAQILDCGLASTPSMFMSTIFDETKCDGAIMITASHLPFNRNGMKFFDGDGGLNKEDIQTIIQNADTKDFVHEGNATCTKFDLIDVYSKHLQNIIIKAVNKGDKPLSNLHIVVDAGNGAGGFYATKVLEPLGANIEGSQFLDPDGHFPNHIPNPEDAKAMASICEAVKVNHADLGIIFDTDVDRSSAVDEKGNPISRNAIVALAAMIAKRECENTTIVTDSVTSDELHDFLENHGLHHHRFKRGYKNVINEAVRLNQEGIDCQLAIETSGHAALKENYFLDDGAYLATKIVIEAASSSVSDLIKDLEYPKDEKEVRFRINVEDFSAYGDQVLADFKEWVAKQEGMIPAKENYEGYRVNINNGWVLIRKSLHDPILPCNFESKDENGCKDIAKIVYEFIKQYKELDFSKLESYIEA